MTRTEELLAAVESAINSNTIISFANPTAIKQLVELVRLQNKAVRQYATIMPLWKAGVEALEAFNKFEQMGK